MFVKNYLDLIIAIRHAPNIFDLHDLYLESEEYFKTNPELNKAEDDFERMIKQQVADAVFSYFPELKPKETILRPQLEAVTDECAGEIFKTTFEIIFNYLENPDRQDSFSKWDWHILTDEQMLEEAIEETTHLSGENRALSIQDRIKTRKIINHFYYFNVVLHKVILSCISAVYEEIPLLSGHGIRYLDRSMVREAYTLKDKMIGLFNKDLQEPEFD